MADTEALKSLLKKDPALYKALIEQVAAEKSLYKFTELMWEFVEPANPFVGNWHIEAICEHLEAITNGEINRLLINIPPGCMKSLLTDVFWPAWEWIHMPHMRYICTSYSANLTERDNGRFLQVVTSDLYKAMWGDRFAMKRESMTKMENNKTGWKIATSTEGMGTGERGNRVIVDDPHNVKDGESEAMLKSTLQYFSEVLPTRVTDPIHSAMLVIMQRVRENDVSGNIIENQLGYVHLMLPMEFEPDRKCYTFLPATPDTIFFEDPRTEAGELLFPERMPDYVVERDKKAMGPYAVAGQFQQAPVPRGGGIIKSKYWKLWPEDEAGEMHEDFMDDGRPVKKLEFPRNITTVIASVDTAFTAKTSADYNALTILGMFELRGMPKIILMNAWMKRLDLLGEQIPRLPGEDERDYRIRRKKAWGMLEWTAYECARWKVDTLLVENKTSGITLGQEIRKTYSDAKWNTILINPKGDKEARMYSIQHLFAEGMVYAPDREWATLTIEEMEKFPKGRNDDLPDCMAQGVKWLRDNGYAVRREEVRADDRERDKYRGGRQKPLYDV